MAKVGGAEVGGTEGRKRHFVNPLEQRQANERAHPSVSGWRRRKTDPVDHAVVVVAVLAQGILDNLLQGGCHSSVRRAFAHDSTNDAAVVFSDRSCPFTIRPQECQIDVIISGQREHQRYNASVLNPPSDI